MKKIILFLALALLATIANAQEQKEYHENGQLMTVGFMENGERTGEWKYYHENGKLKRIAKYENGKAIGEWKGYHENGQLSIIGKFDNNYNYMTGEWKTYHKNGQLSSIGYMYEVKTGEWKNYYENGQLSSIKKYEDGKNTGEWKYYHENGQLSIIGKYENGSMTDEWKLYHENGQLKKIGKFTNGLMTGEWKTYHENGQLSDIGKYENTEKTGEWKFYDVNGNLIKTSDSISTGDAQTIGASTSIRMSFDRENAISNTPDPAWAGTLERQDDGSIKIYFTHFSIGTHDFVITTGSDDDHMMHTSYLGDGYVIRCELIYLRESGVSNQYEGLYKSVGGKYYSLIINKDFD
ncbi:toxin-antitoxin system YwqK family antitoxin [Candidatus Marifrigoribacter sp. Uisw_064]|jgi:antitoxin component YwqK of YwqJK toxin-antitoxin module|uniref:toxin-antitoxin system YwqK family antitoxin n=1 Tax=Candidatus Marifrigoribacter sp. Uisw_064 TaxID=3230970 RepID=UPI003D4190A0